MKPTVGRIVHYVESASRGGEYTEQCRAAIVTDVPRHLVEEPYDGCPNNGERPWLVALCVVHPDGFSFHENVTQDEYEHDSGSWHWPERAQ